MRFPGIMWRLLVVIIVLSNFASAEDGAGPSWLKFGGEYRLRLDGMAHSAFCQGADDAYLLTRFRFHSELIPSRWVRLFAQVQDARVFWKNQNPGMPPFQDALDLRQAYLQIGDADIKRFALRAGRQAMRFGERRLVTDSTWRNVSRSYEGFRATLRPNGMRIDVFSVSVPEIRRGPFNNRRIAGNNFHGIYTALEELVPSARVELYGFWRLNPSVKTELGTPAKSDTKTAGFRWAGKIPARLDYEVEMAVQRGHQGAETVSAWAGHWFLGRPLESAPATPRVFLEHNFATGDHALGDGRRQTFDPLYGSTHERYGLVDLFVWRNLHHQRAGVDLHWRPSWTVTAAINHYWLASPRDGLYSNLGSIYAICPSGAAGRYVGRSADVHMEWDFQKNSQFGAGYAHLFPGTFLEHTTPGAGFHYMYLMLAGRF